MRNDRSAGFTLIEMIVTLFVLSIVLILTLTLFDTNTRLAQVQTSVSDLQQNLRVGHLEMLRDVRAAGRGALPMDVFPAGVSADGTTVPPTAAMWVIKNVAAGTFVDAGQGDNHAVVEGTDILVVRGALNIPVWMVARDTGNFSRDSGSGEGVITVANTSVPNFNIPQSLDALASAIADGRNESLVLVSEVGDTFFQLVTLNPGTSTDLGDSIEIGFSSPPGPWNASFTRFSYVAMVEEYRYYVADERLVDGDGGSSFRPKLKRAHLLPGSGTVYEGDPANWEIDIADGIVDLQVAFGIDRNPVDGLITDNQDENDEWLYNHTDDDDSATGNWNTFPLLYARLSTLAIAERPDRTYQAPTFTSLEDHDYTTAATDLLNGTGRREYRRRWMQTNIDLRNVN